MALFQVIGKLSVFDLGPWGRQVVPEKLQVIRWRGLAVDSEHALREALWDCAHRYPLDVVWIDSPEIEQLGEDLHMRYLGADELSLEV